MAKAKKAPAKKAAKKTAPARASGTERTQSAGKVAIESRISIKTVIGTVVFPDDAEDGFEMDLMTVYGEAAGTKVGESTFGQWTALTGRFRAVRAADGRLYQSQKVFLPNVATEIAVDTLKALDERRKAAEAAGQPVPATSMEFVIKIGARKDASIQQGYRYVCEPLLNEQSDLFSRLEQTALALPNPNK